MDSDEIPKHSDKAPRDSDKTPKDSGEHGGIPNILISTKSDPVSITNLERHSDESLKDSDESLKDSDERGKHSNETLTFKLPPSFSQ